MSSTSSFTFDPFHRAVAGDYDAIGTMEHEITEVLGRIAGSGVLQNGRCRSSRPPTSSATQAPANWR